MNQGSTSARVRLLDCCVVYSPEDDGVQSDGTMSMMMMMMMSFYYYGPKSLGICSLATFTLFGYQSDCVLRQNRHGRPPRVFLPPIQLSVATVSPPPRSVLISRTCAHVGRRHDKTRRVTSRSGEHQRLLRSLGPNGQVVSRLASLDEFHDGVGDGPFMDDWDADLSRANESLLLGHTNVLATRGLWYAWLDGVRQ